jgi:hypothetical protein
MATTNRPSDKDRLFAVVTRYFERNGCTEFPTIRRVQRTLRWSFARILQAVEDDPERMFTTSHNTVPDPTTGEHYVELY